LELEVSMLKARGQKAVDEIKKMGDDAGRKRS
jgi:hypothetical protein